MKKRGNEGFSILELVFVVCIISVIIGFASIGTAMIQRERVVSATRELYADLQKARLDAMTQGGLGYGIRFENHNAYVVFRFNDCNNDYTYDTNTCDGSREETDIIRRELHPSVVIHKTHPATDVNNDVRIFDRFGSPRQTTWGMGGITIFLQNRDDADLVKCVSVSTNRIREGAWNGSSCV